MFLDSALKMFGDKNKQNQPNLIYCRILVIQLDKGKALLTEALGLGSFFSASGLS